MDCFLQNRTLHHKEDLQELRKNCPRCKKPMSTIVTITHPIYDRYTFSPSIDGDNREQVLGLAKEEGFEAVDQCECGYKEKAI